MAEEILNNTEEINPENQPVEAAPVEEAPVAEEPVAEAAPVAEEPAAEASELPETPKAPRKAHEIENAYADIMANFDWNDVEKKGKSYSDSEKKNLEDLYTKSFLQYRVCSIHSNNYCSFNVINQLLDCCIVTKVQVISFDIIVST